LITELPHNARYTVDPRPSPRFELVINPKTAKALGRTDRSVLTRAGEVIQ
jgi:hypothetical protein